MSFIQQCLVLGVLQLTIPTSAVSSGVVSCYFGSWAGYRQDKGTFVVEDIDPHLCTHLIYAFVGLNSDGTIKILDSWMDIDLKGYQRFNALKEKNADLKTLIAIGGWNEGSTTYSNVVSNPNLRSNLVKSAVAFLITHGFDGFDIDWEYPCQRGGVPEDKENFVKLLQQMRSEFDKHGFLLTAAVSAAANSVDTSYDVPKLSKYLDHIHVMTYDLHGSWDGKTGENAPLYPSSKDVSPSQKQLNVNSCIQTWLNRGADPQKIIMGVATYGRTFSLASPNENGIGATAWGPGNPGPYTKSSGMLGYNEICMYQASGGWTTVWNDEQKVPYSYQGNQWVGYDNSQSIKVKVNFAKSLNLGGMMVWSIDTDDFRGECGSTYPILKSINEINRHDERKPHKKTQNTFNNYNRL